ncbi:transposase [Mycoplasma sp. 773]
MQVLNNLKLRGGVHEIYLMASDNLAEINEAIKAVYSKTQIQKCIVHQIRNSTKHVNYKDLKEFTQDMKNIYKSSNLDEASRFLEIFEQKWDSKYHYAVKSWRNNFDELVTFLIFQRKLEN